MQLLLFNSLVQSSFLSSKWGNCNHNQSNTDPNIGEAELDYLALVFCCNTNINHKDKLFDAYPTLMDSEHIHLHIQK